MTTEHYPQPEEVGLISGTPQTSYPDDTYWDSVIAFPVAADSMAEVMRQLPPEFVEDLQGHLTRLIDSRLHDSSGFSAKEAAAETWLGVLTSVGLRNEAGTIVIDDTRTLRRWTLGIASHKIADTLRRKYRDSAMLTHHEEMDRVDTAYSATDVTPDFYDKFVMFLDEFGAAIGKNPLDTAIGQVVVGQVLRGRQPSSVEMAKALDLQPTAVRVSLTRQRKKYQRILTSLLIKYDFMPAPE